MRILLPSLVFILFFTNLYSSDFELKQKYFNNIKNIIIKEERIASSFEKYIINEKAIPSLAELLNSQYLGKNFDIAAFDIFTSYKIEDSELNSRLNSSCPKEEIKEVYPNILSFYKSDKLRENTYHSMDNKIRFMLKNDFAKNIYLLIKSQDSAIYECSLKLGKYCTKNNHIYLYKTKEHKVNGLLMYYFFDNYKKGPILITDNSSLYNEIEFKNIPAGTLLIDFKANRYVKTYDDIKRLE